MAYDAERHKKYYQANKELYKARAIKNNKRYLVEKKAVVNSFKTKCDNCDIKLPPCAYDFHHPNDDKEHSIGKLLHKNGPLKIIKREIEKCIVLCANCHRIEHYGLVVE